MTQAPAPDGFQHLADIWSAQCDAVLKAQEQAGRVVMDGMQALTSGKAPGIPAFDSPEMAKARQALTEMWSSAAAMSKALAAKLPVSGDATVAAVLGRIADPRQWMAGTGEMDDVLGRMAEGPRLADFGEIERLSARVVQAWADVRRRTLEHNAVVLEGWLKAGNRYIADGVGQTDSDPKSSMAQWTATANQQLIEMQRSDAFLASQRETIRASTELRMAQQALIEHFGRQYGFPTRTELDDVHRTVTEMRRELRAMKRVRPAASSNQPEAETVPVPPVARRPAGKRSARA